MCDDVLFLWCHVITVAMIIGTTIVFIVIVISKLLCVVIGGGPVAVTAVAVATRNNDIDEYE